MRQGTLSEGGFEKYRKRTRKEKFLEEMERIVPWGKLVEVIEPYYPKPEGAGRRPIGLERMLRIHFVQHWFNLSDPGVEEALYDSRALRRFVGLTWDGSLRRTRQRCASFGICWRSRDWARSCLSSVNEYLKEQGMAVNRGTIVDATIIHARVRRRTAGRSETRRCTRPARGSSGTSG